MHDNDQTSNQQQAWRQRLQETQCRLDQILEDLCDDEKTWAPDVGIGSAVDHVFEIATSARRLRRSLEGNYSQNDSQDGSEQPEHAEVVLMLKSNNAAILELLTEGLAFGENDAIQAAERAEMVFDHLTLQSHHLGCIILLQQLIDPSRQSALSCGSPQMI